MAYRTIEEIRSDLGISQVEFAERLGFSFRAYQYKINGKKDVRTDWRLSELIRLAEMSGGKVLLEYEGKKYKLDISKD